MLQQWCGYEADDDKLFALYSKGKVLQWDAERALDWGRAVDPGAPVHAEAFPLLSLPIFERLSAAQREQLTAKLMEGALSQFLHGEQGALMVASCLVGLCPDYEAKLYAATQTMDEARHVEVFGRYLKRCGSIQPVDPSLRRFLEMILGASSWLEMLIGMQVIVEGAALSSFHAYRQRIRDPLLGDVLDGVIRDEARHVGFGTLYLRDAVAGMSDDERETVADFAYATVIAFSETRRDSLKSSSSALADVGITLDAVLRDGAEWLKSGKAPRRDTTKDGITEFILPTLRRIGVLTPRIAEKFAQARIPAAATSPLLDQLDALVDTEAR
jgi:hypothetical protein